MIHAPALLHANRLDGMSGGFLVWETIHVKVIGHANTLGLMLLGITLATVIFHAFLIGTASITRGREILDRAHVTAMLRAKMLSGR